MHPFSNPWKLQEFSDIFKGSKKDALGKNGLSCSQKLTQLSELTLSSLWSRFASMNFQPV